MSEEKHPIYATRYSDKVQAVAAARALFAEVYDLLLSLGFEVELRPFAVEKDEVPQIHRLAGLELHDGGYRPLISFNVQSTSGYDYTLKAHDAHYVEVKFEPGWGVKKVSGFDNLVTVARNPKRTPNAMDPKSICEFILKYSTAVRRREEVNDTKRARDILKQINVKANEERAKQLREREGKGRAYVYHSQDGVENELHIQFRGTAEEVRRALSFLDAAFPLPQTASRE
jgi:hypothetical protein